jgi:hypothetical protein
MSMLSGSRISFWIARFNGRFIVENDDFRISEPFKQGIADAEAGRLVNLDTTVNEPYPSDGWKYRFRAARPLWHSFGKLSP